jgi:SAM-dependent methyltransferase
MSSGAHRRPLPPWVYDLVQRAAGADLLRRALRRRTTGLDGVVLDIGGGTGWASGLLPGSRFLLIDLDLGRLLRFRAASRPGSTLAADGRRLPVASGSVDFVLCLLVAHHLDDDGLSELLTESARALRPGSGGLIFVDALWSPGWIPGRLLWLGDRGERPRPRRDLTAILERHFHIETAEELTLLHRYLYAFARPRPQGGGEAVMA